MPRLIQELESLADHLIVGELPDVSKVRPLLGAIIHLLETGSLAPPVREDTHEPTHYDPRDAELSQQASEIAALQAQVAKLAVQPSVSAPPASVPPPVNLPVQTVPPASPAPTPPEPPAPVQEAPVPEPPAPPVPSAPAPGTGAPA